MKRQKVDFEELADRIFFTKKWKDYIYDNRIIFRKNKSFDDIDNALSKSFKNGRGKYEYEVGFLEIYLKRIFKKFYDI